MVERPLVAAAAVPLAPVLDGYALRARALLERLVERWPVVYLGPPDRPDPAPDTPPLSFLRRVEIPERLITGGVGRPAPAVRRAIGRIVAGACEEHRPAALLVWPGLEWAGLDCAATGPSPDGRAGPPLVADRIDCQALTAWRAARRARSARHWLRCATDAVAMLRFERTLVRRAAATIVAGPDDARALKRFAAAGGAVHVIPNGVREMPPARADEEADHPTVVFTGVLDFPPNVEAVRWFAAEVWPQVRRELATAELVVAGRRPVPEIAALVSPERGVTMHADVPDMGGELARAWVAVAPMRSGSGIKNKVLEAWMRERPVVMTTLASNGLALDETTRELVVDEPDAVARRVLELLRSSARRRLLGRASRRVAVERHGWAAAGVALLRLIDEVVGSRGAPP